MNKVRQLEKLGSISDLKAQMALSDYCKAREASEAVKARIEALQSINWALVQDSNICEAAEKWSRWRSAEFVRLRDDLRKKEFVEKKAKSTAVLCEGKKLVAQRLCAQARGEMRTVDRARQEKGG